METLQIQDNNPNMFLTVLIIFVFVYLVASVIKLIRLKLRQKKLKRLLDEIKSRR